MTVNDLPNKWKIECLENVAKWGSGGTPTSTNPSFYNGNIPWLVIGDLNDGYISKSEKTITKLGLDNSSAKIVKPDSVLVAMYGSIGKLGINKIPLATNQAIAFTEEIFQTIYNKYLFHYLFHIREKLHSLGKGGTQKNISQTVLKKVQIPLPPLPEQLRIVAKIEELFSELDKGIETLKTAKQQLKVYRQAVLKYAFEGRLTNPDLKDGELPEGWVEVKSGDVIEFINSGSTPSKEHMSDDFGEIPFLKVYNLNFDGTLNHTKNPVFIKKSIHLGKMKRSICYPNDVLINIVGPPLGKVSVVSNHYPEWNINQAIVAFRPNEKIIPKFLAYQLQNQVLIQWLENTSKATAGQWNVKVSTCREIPIKLPKNTKEQEKLVQEIESRLSVCDKIEESIQQGLQQAEALRQSILKKAFDGKLVPQDPNDEPASMLLERIKAERAAEQPQKRTQKKASV